MKIELNILNKEVYESNGMDDKIQSATWHKLDRLILKLSKKVTFHQNLKYNQMKKIAILLIALTVAFSYSCKKEGKKVQTSISGTLITNGTNDPIKISGKLDKPQAVLLHRYGGDWMGSGMKLL